MLNDKTVQRFRGVIERIRTHLPTNTCTVVVRLTDASLDLASPMQPVAPLFVSLKLPEIDFLQQRERDLLEEFGEDYSLRRSDTILFEGTLGSWLMKSQIYNKPLFKAKATLRSITGLPTTKEPTTSIYSSIEDLVSDQAELEVLPV